MLRRHVAGTDRRNLLQSPASLDTRQMRSQQRCLDGFEQLLRQRRVKTGGVAAEAGVDLETVARVVMHGLVDERVEPGGLGVELLLGLQILDRLHVRERQVAARFRKQRHVVTATLIAVGAAQVDHARIDTGAGRVGEVGARVGDARAGQLEGPVLGPIGDEDDFHVRRRKARSRLRGKRDLASGPRLAFV